MKLIRLLLGLILLNVFLSASDETIDINFKNLEINDLIKITSKIINKNILITKPIKGKVDFISNKAVKKDEIINILMYVLEGKGYTIVDNDDILRIIKINDTSKYNAPIINNNSKKYYQMVTKVFKVSYSNVDYVASKIRHLISKSAKLVTDKESNSIVITDFYANIKTIEKVVKLITKDNKKYVFVKELKNINARDAATNLKLVAKSIFNEKVLKEKVSIIANKDNNSIMLVGKKSNVLLLKARLEKNDENDSLTKRVLEVISLKNVEAKNVIKIIDSIIGKKKYLDPNLKPLSAVDIETNSIILSGPISEVSFIKDLISKLDKEKLQVYVEAKIIEISEKGLRNVGLKYGIAAFDQKLGIATANLGGPIISKSTLDAIGISYNGVKSALGLSASINLLKQNQAVDVVSEPSILCINNKVCSIYVGETISFNTGSTTGTTTVTNIKREDIGLSLKVKPRISSENKVTLEIEAIIEDAKEILQEGQANPDTSKKEIKTTAIVLNGESVILGGLIKNKSDIVNSKIPILGDIPLLGYLFRNKKNVNDKINLVIIITPYIIPKSKDLTYVRNQLGQLKALEAKYTKDLELRLLENKLEKMNQDKKRKNKIKEVKKALAKYNTNDNFRDETDNISAHQKRINKVLGL